MRTMIVNALLYINLLRTFPAIVAFYQSPGRECIEKDIAVWKRLNRIDDMCQWKQLCWLLTFRCEFRNLFYKRVQKHSWFFAKMLTIVLPPLDSLFIATEDIGPGLYIQHGFSTIIAAKSLGANCWVNQQVTIGFSNSYDSPVIGNNVRITAGAVVIGKVTVGDNVMIGANATVTKDVPHDCTVVGNPAFIVKRDGQKVKEYL
ncbi:MAG: serine acetyltransferase [Negativicutes bacterium]|nr:serine acetyltransferase [Negativicutes bacterium]